MSCCLVAADVGVTVLTIFGMSWQPTFSSKQGPTSRQATLSRIRRTWCRQHYGRFLPQDKAALAARILNKVWEAA